MHKACSSGKADSELNAYFQIILSSSVSTGDCRHIRLRLMCKCKACLAFGKKRMLFTLQSPQPVFRFQFDLSKILFEKISKKVLTFRTEQCIIITVAGEGNESSGERLWCGSIAQLGEHLPYKQRVTGSSPVVPTILARQFSWLERQPVTLEVDGSSPFRVASFAFVAQSVEQRTENPRVDGSIPSEGTIMRMQLILAKVEVASSSLVIRSSFLNDEKQIFFMATQPSGKARVCKTLIPQFKSGCRLHSLYKENFQCILFTVRCLLSAILYE